MAKILIVEDAADLAHWIARELTAAGYVVSVVEDGLSALAKHAADPPDLVILDWMLPGLDGLEVLRQLRQNAPTPVLMLTGRNDELDRVVGLEVGADDYLVKPFSMRELLARTHAMLRRVALIQGMNTPQSEARIDIQRYSGIILDPTERRVSRDGLALHLSRTEFDLLHLFLSHPGQAFERADLLDRVWGVAFSDQDRAVDYVIHRLRRKLGPLGEAIETVHAVGYRLRAIESDD